MLWSLDPSFDSANQTAAQFILTDTEETRASSWPHQFEVLYHVQLSADGNALTTTMTVKNTNTNGEPFTFTTALHSYFTCQALSTVLSDFEGVTYKDSIDPEQPGIHKIQTGDITFGKEVDRVYLDTKNALTIPQSNLTLSKENLPEAVVWNPYVEKATALSDMPDDGWQNFICIEPARVVEPAHLDPGQQWVAVLKITSA